MRWENKDDFIDAVVEEALKRSKYKSICIDEIDQCYETQDFDEAVEMAILDTAWWEGDFPQKEK